MNTAMHEQSVAIGNDELWAELAGPLLNRQKYLPAADPCPSAAARQRRAFDPATRRFQLLARRPCLARDLRCRCPRTSGIVRRELL